MKEKVIILIITTVLLNSCSPRITTRISKTYPPIDYREKIKVFGLEDSLPEESEEIGTLKIGDTGFSVNC